MDIAAASIVMAQTNVKQEANVAVMDKALSNAESKGSQMVQMLQQSTPEPAHPTLGAVVDFKA